MRGIGYGGDYNPEQWPEATWAEDIWLMAEAGVNLVTVGVFSWSKLQPAPGELTAGWLDRVLDLLAEAGIGVDLATGTASPPPWLVAAHPEILPVTADGRRLAPGARQHYCPSAPAFRAAAADLAARMARRYAGHPAVALWHVGNEYGCHVPACYCELSAEAFRQWLRARYGQLGRLNEAWGGAVWSQDYTRWDQVQPPRTAPTFANPAHQLDFARFSSGELLACYRAERDVIAARSPGAPVTTNFMSLFRPVDQFRWAAELDVVSVDSYPDPAEPESYLLSAMTCDLTRSVGGGRPWLLMEQAPSAVSWRTVNVPKAPGQYRALSLQAVARGGDAILSFQWRAAVTGSEKFHSAMLPHAGTDSRVWREVVALGADLGRLAPVAGSPVPAEAAILLDWESWWALELDPHPSRLRLIGLLRAFYRPLFEAGVNADFAHPESDLSTYRLVIVPALYLVSDIGADNVGRFVADGGTILMSFFSGIALLLAAVGIYGVISYSVAQRTHEMGIRSALGASSQVLLRMVLGRGFLLTLIGLAIGLAGTLAALPLAFASPGNKTKRPERGEFANVDQAFTYLSKVGGVFHPGSFVHRHRTGPTKTQGNFSRSVRLGNFTGTSPYNETDRMTRCHHFR